MRRITFMILGLGLALAPAARAEDWSKTYTLTGKPDLRVETSDANIRVDTWNQNTIEAKVTAEGRKIGEGGVKVLEHQAGDSVGIEVRLPHADLRASASHTQSHRVEVEIHMPHEGHVNLRTGDGSIRLSGFKGTMEVQSGDGGQDLEAVDGSLKAALATVTSRPRDGSTTFNSAAATATSTLVLWRVRLWAQTGTFKPGTEP